MDGVSFLVTVFDKAAYLPRVVEALAAQTGPFRREFVFVDDGSTDGSADLIERLTAGWSDPVRVIRQRNRGASAATNTAAAEASLPWLKLVDGDDLLVPGATARLLEAAHATGQTLAYGDLGHYDARAPAPLAGAFPVPRFAMESDGLSRFIRNCPSNSSALLVSAGRYRAAGGCDERLVSPDLALYLRLFVKAGGARVHGPVALVPDAAPGRLSGQRRRSRYESVLALYHLVTETPDLAPRHVRLACRRALARAYRFHRGITGRKVASPYLLPLIGCRLGLPLDAAAAIYRALGAFTEDGRCERPANWLPGALREDGGAAAAG